MLKQRCFAVILVGKSSLLREGLAGILRAANFRMVTSVSKADDLRPSNAKLHLPLYLILHNGEDFRIALEQIAILRSQQPDARIAVVADSHRMKEVTSAFRAGANGYFGEVISCDRFIRSIELVMMGETIFPSECLSLITEGNRPHIDRKGEEVAFPTEDAEDATAPLLFPREKVVHAPHLVEAAASGRSGEEITSPTDATAPRLSPQEKVILRCIIQGDTNKCIARKIDIAEATVKVHVKAILRKIGVQNRTQAAIWGLNNGSHTHPTGDGCLASPADAKTASSIPTDRLREG